ncbi:circularly permuted type 2 ATP-grasp protein [Pseudonocardia sp.]|uniref:circularly permuted type 2 ATP-grasp protein n=1 Tax=Pseudonocardia sp. TaxID=60912 RepID=UPI003D138DC5
MTVASDPEAPTRSPRLLDGYRALPGVHDELVDGDGRVREQWARLGRVLDEMGHAELHRRRGEAARLLADDGVAYRVGPDSAAPGVAWRLDPVPVLLGSAEWAEVEGALVQRAELLNLVLADLYGPRTLLRRRLVPPEMVLAHPGFVREVDGVRSPGAMLVTLAVDLARDAAGRRWALADRTQTPAGAGYALANRVVVSKVLPSMFRDAQVHRLAPFFRGLRSALQAAAPTAAGDPRIVVLTPGPWSETAFEHGSLASYLGYPLVEGADLTVRDGHLWMRSLERLERVDVVLRRVDSSFCDPLELRSESLLGVPGLVEASRLGTVSLANTLGSGVLENPALLAVLPRLAEALLGQELRMPSVPTWWCGDDLGRRHVLAHLDELVVKSTTRERGATTLLGWKLTAAQREQLRARIEAAPHGWVGQERLDLATVPALTGTALAPHRAALRAFLVARGDSYAAMPGGLARVTPPGGGFVASPAGAVSKDVWVVASEPEDPGGFWLQGPGPDVPDAALPARAAENLYWLGRYLERAEATARLLQVVRDRRNAFPGDLSPAGAGAVGALLRALTDVTDTRPGFHDDGVDVGAELSAITADATRPGTLAFALRRLRDAAYPVRDQLSGDTWLVMGALERDLAELGDTARDAGTIARVLTSLLALGGLAADSMVRDQGWRFLDAGRRVERAVQLCALLEATVTRRRDDATDSLLLESVLTAAESIITYRRRHRSHADLATVLELLLLDPANPRSVGYQLDRLAEDVAALAGPRGLAPTAPERIVLEATSALRVPDLAATARTVTGTDGSADRAELAAFLVRIVDLLHRVSDAVEAAHFTRLPPQHPLNPGLRLV